MIRRPVKKTGALLNPAAYDQFTGPCEPVGVFELAQFSLDLVPRLLAFRLAQARHHLP